MSMIFERMAPLISSYPLAISVTSDSTINFYDRQYEARRLESRTMLPVLCVQELVAEVTLRETRSNYHTMDWDSRRGAIPTFVNDEGAANLTNDGDLVDVARNPCSSIKSAYFAPNPSDPSILPDDSTTTTSSYKSKRHQRVSSGMETLLKIDYELSPLQYQYSQIIGKARALSLSSADFDLDVCCHLDQSDVFGQSVLSPNLSNYFLDQAFSREAASSICNKENRPGLVDKASPLASFSVVGKPAPREGSRTNCLYENDSSRRQEALDFASHDPSRALENFNDLGSPSPVGHSAFYLPTTNIHASRGETVLRERSCNECVSDNSFRLHCKSNSAIERDASARQGWSVHRRTNASPSRVLRRMEYDSHHRYLEKTVEYPRVSGNNFEIRKQRASMSENGLDRSRQWNSSHLTCRSSNYTSKSTIVKVIDNTWRNHDNEQATNKRSNERFGIPSSDQNSTAMQKMSTTCGGNHKSAPSEAECVTKDDRISSPFRLQPIERGVGPDRQISHTISASVCAPQIRVVSVNTEFRATVEKRYTNRAVSPIQNSHSRDEVSTSMTMTTMTRSLSNVILAGSMSNVFIQEVRANSSTEVLRAESSPEMSLIDANKRDDIVTSKRSFTVQKIDSQLESSSPRSSESEEDEADSTMAGCRRVQHLRLPEAKERITIVPIVLTDGIPDPPKTADINFAIPRYVDKVAPKLSYQIIPFNMRKSQKMRSPSDSDDETPQHRIARPACLSRELTKEKSASRTPVCSINHDDLYMGKDYAPSTNSVMKNSWQSIRGTASNARKVQEHRQLIERPKQRIVRAIPGMRSSPEDFLCDT
ncbi:hypothetical protein X777_05449 [Ooceraea biroi]|uniref:Uncharacterized protein n=1 Tax=Ooceraea biroi TaxID=2015173 RepID=A0A026X1J5_OOCBI|nr:hypothetical protein X777_05449 [Ooceraea biroi]